MRIHKGSRLATLLTPLMALVALCAIAGVLLGSPSTPVPATAVTAPATTPAAIAQSPGGEQVSEWYEDFIFEDKSFSSQLARNLAWTYAGAADIGEVISTAKRVTDGDIHSWYDEWLATADRVHAMAAAFEEGGHTISAGEAYFRAATYYQAAGFFMVAPADRDKARHCRKRGHDSFVKALDAHPNITYERIPYEGTTLPAYVARCRSAPAKGPLVIANTGFDGTSEDTFHGVAWAAMKRGYHVLVFEGPGQGEMIMDHDLHFRPDWEVVGRAVVDYALTLPFVDENRVAYMGISMGGYLAPRAVAFDDRVAALIANGGLYKLYESAYRIFPEDQIALIESDPARFNAMVAQMAETDISLQWLFDNSTWRFGSADYADFMRGQKEYTLEHVVQNIQAPTLVVESVSDGMFTGQPQNLYDALQCPKTYVVFTREEAAQAHCQLGASSLSNEKIFNWLDGVMGDSNVASAAEPQSLGAAVLATSEPATAASAQTTDAPMFKLHHMGVVVRNLDEAVEIYTDILGLDPDDERIQRFTGKANKTAMVPIGRPEDFNSFELMEPISDDFLDVYIKADLAEGFFHLAVLVDNFDEKVETLKAKGFTVIVEETVDPFPGCELLREAYIMPKDSTRGILIDLIDAKTFPASEGGLAR